MNIIEAQRIKQYQVFLDFDNADNVDLDLVAERAGIKKNAAIKMFGLLKNNPDIYKRLLNANVPDGKIPSWVARPKQASSNDPRQGVRSINNNEQERQEELQRQDEITPPIGKKEGDVKINYVDQLRNAIYEANKRLQHGSAGTEDSHIGEAVSKATLQEVEVRTQAIMQKVALNPSNVLLHAYLSSTVDPDTGRTLFEGDFGDFVNWCITYATSMAYGVRVGIITTGQGSYEKMKQSALQLILNKRENFIAL